MPNKLSVKKYTPLAKQTLRHHISYCQPPAFLFTTTKDDPAIDVMTDFRKIRAITTQATTSINECNNYMIMNNVRLLLVVNKNRIIEGIITAADILGEKPLAHIQKRGGTHDDIQVGDIMTATADLEALTLDDVEDARVGNIVETLLKDGRQHAIVTCANKDNGETIICGMFSATQISKQLGIPVEPVTIATSFSELERAIVA